jgi:hypothetical protein
MGAQAGGFLATPPGLDGKPGLGIPGISGIPRLREWDAVAAADAPALTGNAVHFFALRDGTLILDEDEPDDALAPLATALEHLLQPPYRAEGIRQGEVLWAVSAVQIRVVQLPPDTVGEQVELTRFGGERQLTVDDREVSSAAFVQLDRLAPPNSDFALRAERLDDTWWAATVDLL